LPSSARPPRAENSSCRADAPTGALLLISLIEKVAEVWKKPSSTALQVVVV
jgi:hypothetical protein